MLDSDNISIFDSLDDADMLKLGKLDVDDTVLHSLLNLFELIPNSNKVQVFDIIDTIFSSKDDNAENITNESYYTAKLLGESK